MNAAADVMRAARHGAEREFALAEADGVSLRVARRYGFTVVSVKRDWKTVFAPRAVRR